jgi:hypothetical protein
MLVCVSGATHRWRMGDMLGNACHAMHHQTRLPSWSRPNHAGRFTPARRNPPRKREHGLEQVIQADQDRRRKEEVRHPVAGLAHNSQEHPSPQPAGRSVSPTRAPTTPPRVGPRSRSIAFRFTRKPAPRPRRAAWRSSSAPDGFRNNQACRLGSDQPDEAFPPSGRSLNLADRMSGQDSIRRLTRRRSECWPCTRKTCPTV